MFLTSFAFQGKGDYFVDSSLVTFANHGCNGEWNIGSISDVHEASLQVPEEYLESLSTVDYRRLPHALRQVLYNAIPVEYQERRGYSYYPVRRIFNKTAILSHKPISAGDEILDNYMEYGGEVGGATFWHNLINLGRECGGQAGSIEQYQDHGKTQDQVKKTSTGEQEL